MRFEGKIESWNDDKGYGFIALSNGGKQIFIHISAFKYRDSLPEIGQIVTYVLSSDKQGRACGKSAVLEGDRFHRKKIRKAGVFSLIVVTLFFSIVGISVFMGKIQLLILELYMVASLITFIAYALDKSAARKGRWRTQESTLHLLSLFGGWPGAIIAQRKLRNKSKKQDFRFVFWITVLLNIGVFCWLHTADGRILLQELGVPMLLENFLPDYELTVTGLAESVGVSRQSVNELP